MNNELKKYIESVPAVADGYFSSLQGHGTSIWPSASGAPTVWRQGTKVP